MENHKGEVDIVSLFKIIWIEKKLIIIFCSIFIIIGVAFALLSPVKFTSSTTFIPSNQEGMSSSNLSGVASLVGISLNNDLGNPFPPTMYPKIAESIEFKRLILERFIDEGRKLSLKDFLIKYYNIEKSGFENENNPTFVSEQENELFKIIENKILNISVNKTDRYVSIFVEMPKSEYAANTCINAREILQKIIIGNKIKSAKQNLKFSEEQLRLKRLEFDDIQNKLAYFKDSNLNIVTSTVINEMEKLEAEFQIINAVIIELSKQVEQNKLQVSRDTPVFSIVKEASMPVLRSSPKRTLIVLIFGFIGFFISTLVVVLKRPFKNIINEINS